MKQYENNFFKTLENDYNLELNYNLNVLLIAGLYVFGILMFFGAFNLRFIIFEQITYNHYFSICFFVLIGIIVSILAFLLTKIKIRLNKRYGKNVELKMMSIIKEKNLINELQEYYEQASIDFKKNILEKIIKEEIARELNLKDENNINEMLCKIRKKDQINIHNY